MQVRHTRLSEDLVAVQEKLARTQEERSRRTLQSEVESLGTTKERLGRVLARLESRERQARDCLHAIRLADYVVLGGGNAKRIGPLSPDTRLGDNRNAFLGGFRLWEEGLSVASCSHPPFRTAASVANPEEAPVGVAAPQE